MQFIAISQAMLRVPLFASILNAVATRAAPFPALWFGANVSGPENPAQLQLDAKYPLVIYGWQHEDLASNYTNIGLRLSEQCAALKRMNGSARCYVYREAPLAMPMFVEQRQVMQNTSRRDWFMQNPSTGLPIRHTGFGTLGMPLNLTLLWNFSKDEVASFYLNDVVGPIAVDPNVDGVFFDMVDWPYCNARDFQPCDPKLPRTGWNEICGLQFPGGEAGRKAYFDTNWRLFRQVAERLHRHGKVALFSSTNYVSNVSWPTQGSSNNSYIPLAPGADKPNSEDPGACPRPLEAAIEIMKGTPWTRYYEQWAPRLPAWKGLDFNRSVCIWQIEDALAQTRAGVPLVMHTGVPGDGSQHVDLNVSVASFLIAAAVDVSYWGFSSGKQWYDEDYRRIPLYERDVGKPLEDARRLGCCDGALQPHTYMHDAEGFGDLYNTVLRTAEECAALCCSESACKGFQWTSNQSGTAGAGNCTGGGPCCWIKPSIGRIEHITYDDKNKSSIQYYMVSGSKKGMVWQRRYEHVDVSVDCAVPTAKLEWRSHHGR